MSGFNDKFVSTKQEWITPPGLFEQLNQEFNFNFDLAADKDNTKCKNFYSVGNDALSKSWENKISWLNPPFGSKEHKLENWIKKAYLSSQNENTTIVMLIPARTNTKWWHTYCMKAKEIKLICGRPKFIGCKHGLPWPLAIIVFQKHENPTEFSSLHLTK